MFFSSPWKALQHQIAIYSPHTAHDAWSEGVNTWLISAVTNGEKTLPISPSSDNREMYEVSGILKESANMKQFKKTFRKINIGKIFTFSRVDLQTRVANPLLETTKI